MSTYNEVFSSGVNHARLTKKFKIGVLPVFPVLFAVLIVVIHIPCIWGGFACMDNPCMHGICIDYLQINSSHQCYCRNGFTGYSCQINWDECRSNPCLNGGSCVDGIASFNCSCPENFAGVFCEVDLSICEDVFPCQNNGTCTLDTRNVTGTGLICSCPPGFAGHQCEIDISVCNTTENVCQNGGKCIDGVGNRFYCECEPGWSGETCHLDIDECESQPCHNGGICVNKINDFSCACPFGFTGRACETRLRICEENPCLNGAFCLNEQDDEDKKTCYCVPDYHGTLCELRYDDCDPAPKCLNGGTCIDGVGEFTCSCPLGFFGSTCQCTAENVTEPECTFNGTYPWPSMSETVIYQSASIAAPGTLLYPSQTVKDLDSQYASRTSYIHSIDESGKLSPTASQDVPVTTMSIPTPSPYDPGGSELVTNLVSNLDQDASLQTHIIRNETISVLPTQTIMPPIKTSIFEPYPSISFDVIYEPSPTIRLDGSEGSLSPDSIFPSPSAAITEIPNPVVTPPPVSSKESLFPNMTEFMSQPLSLISPVLQSSDYGVTKDTSRVELDITPHISSPFPHLSQFISADVVSSPIVPVSLEVSASIKYPPGLQTVGLTADMPYVSSKSMVDVVEETEFFLPPVFLHPTPSPTTEVGVQTDMPPASHMSNETPSLPYATTPIVGLVSPLPSESIFEDSQNATVSRLITSLMSPPIVISTQSLHLAVSLTDMLSPVVDVESSPVVSQDGKSTWYSVGVGIEPDSSPTIQPTIVSVPAAPEPTSVFVEPSQSSQNIELVSVTIAPEASSTAYFSEFPLVSASPTTPMMSVTPSPPSNTTDPCTDYCNNNAKCIADSIEPICLCSFKFTGNRCELNKEKFQAASFTGDSFLSFRVPNESISKVDIQTKLVTIIPEGVLLYTGIGRMYALIFTQNGHVTLHFSCGSQSMHFVETRTRVDNGFNFTLDFKMEMIVQGVNELRCSAEVSVNQSYVMKGEQIIGRDGILLAERPIETVYLGGVAPFHSDASLNDDLVGVLPGFRGCLHSLMINQEDKDIFDDALDGKEVAECSSFGCVANPCHGSASCVTTHMYPFWQCVCSQGYKGHRCQIIVCSNNPCLNGATCTYSQDSISMLDSTSTGEVDTLPTPDSMSSDIIHNTSTPFVHQPRPICLCPIGFSGKVCQHKVNVTKPAFQPISGYSSFVAYDPIPRFIDWFQLKFHFVTKNMSQISILLYSGNDRGLQPLTMHPHHNHHQRTAHESEFPVSTTPFPNDNNPIGPVGFDQIIADAHPEPVSDFFAITFLQGFVALTWNLGSGTQRITTPSRIDNRLNIHTLFAGRSGRQAWLKVDGMRNVTGKTPGPLYRLNADANELYLGGYQSYKFEGLSHDLPLHQGFQGCIFDLGFRIKNRLYLPKAIRGRNVKNCFEEDC